MIGDKDTLTVVTPDGPAKLLWRAVLKVNGEIRRTEPARVDESVTVNFVSAICGVELSYDGGQTWVNHRSYQ